MKDEHTEGGGGGGAGKGAESVCLHLCEVGVG